MKIEDFISEFIFRRAVVKGRTQESFEKGFNYIIDLLITENNRLFEDPECTIYFSLYLFFYILFIILPYSILH